MPLGVHIREDRIVDPLRLSRIRCRIRPRIRSCVCRKSKSQQTARNAIPVVGCTVDDANLLTWNSDPSYCHVIGTNNPRERLAIGVSLVEILIWDLGEGRTLLIRWAEIASRICDKIASARCRALKTFLDDPSVRRSGIDNSLEGLRADFDSCDEREAFRRGMSAYVNKEFGAMN